MDSKQSNGSQEQSSNNGPTNSCDLETVITSYQNGDFKQAAEKALLFTREFPNDEVALSILANSQYQLGDLHASIATMERIILQSPNNYQIHNNLGLAYQQINEAKKAIEAINTALQLNPEYGHAFYNLGIVLFEQGDVEGSIVSYERSIELRPTHVSSYVNLGIAKKEAKRFHEAEECYQTAIKVDPNNAESYHNLGILKLETAELAEAEKYFRKAIELRPTYSEAYLNLGIVLAELGNLQAAKTTFEKITVFDPTYPRAYALLGKTHFSLGNEAESIKFLEKALELDSGDIEACRELGALSMGKKDYTRAASLYSRSTILANSVECLKCYFHIDTEEKFLPKLFDHINNNSINASIGALVDSFNRKYECAIENPFCNRAQKYSVNINLNNFLDFEKKIREPVYEALRSKKLTYRSQGLLTNGKQTAGNIFNLDLIRNTEIETVIRSELDKYRRKFFQVEEGLFRNWPEKYTLRGWLVRMEEGGNLSPHIHPHGWLTGSIYINVPSPKTNYEGDLIISRGENFTPNSEDSLILEVSTGHICLFPSSLYHHTLPFKGEEERIVLAFDVVPDLNQASS